jgi:hypothetical protein
MDEARALDEFERIKLHEDVARARLLVGQYRTALAFYHEHIETKTYEIGKLDERLGDPS